VIFFSDRIEKFIPPKKGKSHIMRIIRDLIEFEPESKKTDLTQVLKYVNKVIKKKSIVFLLSDFISPNFEDALKLTNKKHDLIAVNVHDVREREMPKMGLVPFKDLETGEYRWVNTSSKKARNMYKSLVDERVTDLHAMFKRAGIDFADIATDQDYIKPLMKLFKKRG
ncbi:MAG: hypothetical protein ACJAZG_002218, partial [Granulosicoccus sp.]